MIECLHWWQDSDLKIINIMYGRNNYLGSSNNSSNNNYSYNNGYSSNNNSSYNNSSYGNNNSSNNNYSYGGNYSYGSYNSNRNNDTIGTYRSNNYKFQQAPPTMLTNIIEHWKSFPPGCISSREELLHLSPIEVRVEDYFLIRNKKLNKSHQDKLVDAIRKECFNEELVKTNCYNLLPYSREQPFSIDTIRALAKKEENRGYSGNSSYGNSSYGNNNSSYGNYSSYGSYGNNNNSSYGNNNYSSSYNTRGNSSNNNIFSSSNNNSSGNNNIFSRNSTNNSSYSSNNNNNSSSNIFSSNNSSSNNNIFSRNSNNNSSYGNSSNNIFSSNNNNSSGGNNNIFNTRSNNNSSNIFSNNNSGGASNNIFNNNNGGASNNIFNNNNNGNRNIFGNNNSNNIFSNNNNGNRNIFGNNNNNNNNNGGNNSLFTNNPNYNSVDPRFYAELQTYMKNVNEVVRKLNGSIPSNYVQNTQPQSGSIFTGNEVHPYESFDPFEMSSFIKKKRQEQEFVVTLKNDDRAISANSSRISSASNNEGVRRSQIMENSQITRQRMRTTYNDHSKIRGSAISNNQISNRGSHIRSNSKIKSQFQKKEPASSKYESKSPAFEQNSSTNGQQERSRSIKKSRFVYETNDPCKCQMELKIIWNDADAKKCELLPDSLSTMPFHLERLKPNSVEWKADMIQILKRMHPIIRKDAELQIINIQLEQKKEKSYLVKGEISQRLFNFDINNYQFFYRNIKKGTTYNLVIANKYGQVSWDFPVDITNLDFQDGGEFSIEDNAIICQKEQLNGKCHVVFNSLPAKVKKIAKEANDAEAKKYLASWVTKISEGRFELTNIRIDHQTEESGWSMMVSKFT